MVIDLSTMASILFWAFTVLAWFMAALQFIQIIFPFMGWDKNKHYIFIVKGIRKISLRNKSFLLSVRKSYELTDDMEIENLKNSLKTAFSEFDVKIYENSNRYKIIAHMKRCGFDMTIDMHIHDEVDEPWIRIKQSVNLKFNEIKEGLNIIFYNLQRFNVFLTPSTNKVDVILDAEGLKMFKELFKEIGTDFMGNDISMTQKEDHTFIKISGSPEIEFANKIKDLIALGHI